MEDVRQGNFGQTRWNVSGWTRDDGRVPTVRKSPNPEKLRPWARERHQPADGTLG